MQLNLARARRANVSVELALVAVLVFFPLMAGLTDVFFIVAAKYQLNAAQHALYAYAWNNPANAVNTTGIDAVLAAVNQHSLPQVALSSAAYNTAAPSWGDGSTITVTYSVTSTVSLPVPVPGWHNPFVVSSAGTVQLQ